MKKSFLIGLFCLFFVGANASHIVGGEFELLHIFGNTYRVNLILYFDVRNGNVGAKDPSVTARIFRMRGDVAMMDVFLPFISETPIIYSQPECSIGELATSKLIYSSTITLSAGIFNDPQGYYLTWQRCCRNYSINNIFSNDPQSSGLYAGQTFYLEFPPVVKNGQPFINSTPSLFPPLSDYACKGKPYYVDFTGTDNDGDSLVYSLIAPLNTLTPTALPIGGLPLPKPTPNPYPEVVWRSPYSFSNIMGGAPDLKISQEGLLTVTPLQTGLFVFAVKCEEFRGGVKIGEVRRDFQMLAVQCRTATPPIIIGKNLKDANFTYKKNMVVTFDHGTKVQDRCIEVRVSDKDVNNDFDGNKERIKIRAIGIGNRLSTNNVILPTIKSATLTAQDSTVIFKICFTECPTPLVPYTIGIIASDDACALPLLDTLRITVNPTPNIEPYFITGNVSKLMNEGEPLIDWPIRAVDEDGDPMELTVLTEPGVILSDVGMNFNVLGQSQDTVNAHFTWDPKCNIYNFKKKTEFEVKILVKGTCALDTMALDLKIKLPENNAPVIDNTLSSEKRTIEITKKIYETINFDVLGNDIDVDPLILNGDGLNFNMAEYGATFPQTRGDGSVGSQFNWFINCNKVNLQTKSDFAFRFLVIDSTNYCRIYKADTLDLIVHVEPPVNMAPELQATSNTLEQIINGQVSTTLGQLVSITLLATDNDSYPIRDSLMLKLIDATGNVQPSGYTFSTVSGESPIEGLFTWQPDCSIFKDGIYENDYTFTFSVQDLRCFSGTGDTLKFDLKIKDVDASDDDFRPMNFVSPNGDGCNDYFSMTTFETAPGTNCTLDGDVKQFTLPNDNCMGRFAGIRIYNRWGKQVYESASRDFIWTPSDMPVGVYYYYLTFTNKHYRGTVSVRY